VFLKSARALWWTARHQPELRAAHVVREEAGGARALLERLADARESAQIDRIYRLVRAALEDTTVPPVSPERAAHYERLEALVRMPIGDAFRQLAEREPALDRLAATVDPFPVDADKAMGWQIAQRRRVAKLVGPRAGHADAVLRAYRMVQLVTAYLQIAAGDTSCGDATTSYDDWHRNELDAKGALRYRSGLLRRAHRHDERGRRRRDRVRP
jgi:hypothetical protein